MGKEGYIAFAEWPQPNEEMVRKDAEELETTIKDSLTDYKKIIQVTGISPSNVTFYTAASWKWKVYMKALELAQKEKLDIGTLIRDSFKDDELKALQKEIPAFARTLVEDVKKTPVETAKRRLAMDHVNEQSLIEDAASFFQKEFGCTVTVYNENDPWIEDPANRAKRAKPYRPAIYVA